MQTIHEYPVCSVIGSTLVSINNALKPRQQVIFHPHTARSHFFRNLLEAVCFKTNAVGYVDNKSSLALSNCMDNFGIVVCLCYLWPPRVLSS